MAGAVALKQLTSTIPIVFVLVPDPIASGLVESLARPGGDATGLSLMSVDLSGKRLELLKEAVPNLSRVALLLDLFSPAKERQIKANQTAAKALGISLWPAEISAPDEIDRYFLKLPRIRADTIIARERVVPVQRAGACWRGGLGTSLANNDLYRGESATGFLMSYGQDFPILSAAQ